MVRLTVEFLQRLTCFPIVSVWKILAWQKVNRFQRKHVTMRTWERCKNINVDKNITGSLLEVAMRGQCTLNGGTGRGVVGEGSGELNLKENQAWNVFAATHGTPPYKRFLIRHCH